MILCIPTAPFHHHFITFILCCFLCLSAASLRLLLDLGCYRFALGVFSSIFIFMFMRSLLFLPSVVGSILRFLFLSLIPSYLLSSSSAPSTLHPLCNHCISPDLYQYLTEYLSEYQEKTLASYSSPYPFWLCSVCPPFTPQSPQTANTTNTTDLVGVALTVPSWNVPCSDNYNVFS